MRRTVNQAVKQDTAVIHEYAVAIKMNTEDILARVNSIRRDGHVSNTKHKRIEDWIEDMAVLSSYAETTYQRTIIDPADMGDKSVVSESLPRLSEDSVLSPSPRRPSPDHSQHTVADRPREADPTASPTQHAARLMLGEISAPSTPSGPTTALSGISAGNLDSSTLTNTLTRDSEHVNGTGNDTSHQLSLFGWKKQTASQKPLLGAPGTGESLLFRTALKCFQNSGEARVSEGQPPQSQRHCEVSLFLWVPTLEASAMENAPSFVFFTVTLPPNVSEAPLPPATVLFSIPRHRPYGGQPEAGDNEVILTFFDAKSLQQFRDHLMGSTPRMDETRQEFALAGYNAVEYSGLGTSTRIPRPIDKLFATTHTWPTVSIFEPSTLGPPRRLVVESQDGLIFINIRTGQQYYRFIRLSTTKADECLLVISQSLMSESRCNFLMLISSPGSPTPVSINAKELQGIHPEQRAYCEYRFQNLGSLYRFQQAVTGYAVLYDGWPHEIGFGRRDLGLLKLPKEIHWGHTARKPRVQILRDTGNGAIRVAIFSPPRRRHPESSQTTFQLIQGKHRFTYHAMSNSEEGYVVGITDDSWTLPSDTIDEWTGVSPNEGNFLDLSIGGVKAGKSSKTMFYFKEESGKLIRLPSRGPPRQI